MRLLVALLAGCSYEPVRIAPVDAATLDVAPEGGGPDAGPSNVAVQTGTLMFTAADTTLTATLTAIDPARSFLMTSTSVDSAVPSSTTIGCELVDATTVRCRRVAANVVATVRWSVASFESGVSVQRGTFSILDVAAVTVPITPIDPLRSFPIVAMVRGGNDYNSDDLFRVRLADAMTLEVARQNAAGDIADVHWQVIQLDGASVQSGTVAFAAPDTSKVVSLATPAQSGWLLFTYLGDGGGANDIGQKLVRAQQTDSNTLVFDRDRSGSTLDLAWHHVVLGGGAVVQHGTRAFATTETSVDVAIANLDPTRSIATAGGLFHGGGKSPYAAVDNPGVAMTTLELVDATTLRLQRAATGGSTADVGWFVVQF